MTPEQTAARIGGPVDALGGAFLTDPRTLRRARELGLSGWASYVAGRGGALGNVHSDTVAAALGLIAPEAVRAGWEAAAEVLPPREVAEHVLAECHRWGAERLDDLPGVQRLAVLAGRVASAVDSFAMPLFAAWRAMTEAEMPEHGDNGAGRSDASSVAPAKRNESHGPGAWAMDQDQGQGARAAIALHLLHEHRAAALLLAVRTSGLSPVEALVGGPGRESSAVAFGWEPPYPQRIPLLRRRVWAGQLADRLAGHAFAVLTAADRAELVSLADAALEHSGLSMTSLRGQNGRSRPAL